MAERRVIHVEKVSDRHMLIVVPGDDTEHLCPLERPEEAIRTLFECLAKAPTVADEEKRTAEQVVEEAPSHGFLGTAPTGDDGGGETATVNEWLDTAKSLADNPKIASGVTKGIEFLQSISRQSTKDAAAEAKKASG